MVTDNRYLLYLLFSSERAWAQSKDILDDIQNEPNALRQNRMLNRFKRAVQYAEKLQEIAAQVSDLRTSLEAEAYASQLRGYYCIEIGEWVSALEEFATSCKIYENLAQVASRRTCDLYLSQVAEMEPQQRFCKYSLARETGRTAADSLLESVDSIESVTAAKLKGKMQDILRESATTTANGVDAIFWRQTLFPIRSDTVRSHLSVISEKLAKVAEFALDSDTSELDAQVFSDALSALESGCSTLASEASKNAKEGKTAFASDLTAVSKYLLYISKFLRFFQSQREADNVLNSHLTSVQTIGGIEDAAVLPSDSPWAKSFFHNAIACGSQENTSIGSSSSSKAYKQAAALYATAEEILKELVVLAGKGAAQVESGVTTTDGAIVLPEDSKLIELLSIAQGTISAKKLLCASRLQVLRGDIASALALLNEAKAQSQKSVDGVKGLKKQIHSYLNGKKVFPGYGETSPGWSSAVSLSGVNSGNAQNAEELLHGIAEIEVSIKAKWCVNLAANKLGADKSLSQLQKDMEALEIWKKPTFRKTEFKKDLSKQSSLYTRNHSVSEVTAVALAGSISSVPTLSSVSLSVVPMPEKPILLDLAFSSVTYPDISSLKINSK